LLYFNKLTTKVFNRS